jgi:hypothetical protein
LCHPTGGIGCEARLPLGELQQALRHNYGYYAERVTVGAEESAIRVLDHSERLLAIITRSADELHWVIDGVGTAPVLLPLDTRGWTIADSIVEARERPV